MRPGAQSPQPPKCRPLEDNHPRPIQDQRHEDSQTSGSHVNRHAVTSTDRGCRSPSPRKRKRAQVEAPDDNDAGAGPARAEHSKAPASDSTTYQAEEPRAARGLWAFCQRPVPSGLRFSQAEMIRQRAQVDGVLSNIAPAARQEVLGNALVTLVQLMGLDPTEAVTREARIYSAHEDMRLRRYRP